MVRWKIVLALAVLLLFPTISGKNDDDDDDERGDEAEDDEDDDDDDDEDDGGDKVPSGGGEERRASHPVNRPVAVPSGRRAPILVPAPKPSTAPKTVKKRPLECYVCAFKSETPLRACLDPIKFRVHTITCHSVEDKCFTSVIAKGDAYEAVVRGCRTGCVGSTETTCCEHNRCNNQAFAMPVMSPRVKQTGAGTGDYSFVSKSNKRSPPTILFFVSVLLILQTATKVAFV